MREDRAQMPAKTPCIIPCSFLHDCPHRARAVLVAFLVLPCYGVTTRATIATRTDLRTIRVIVAALPQHYGRAPCLTPLAEITCMS
jgi:hypothetical protein